MAHIMAFFAKKRIKYEWNLCFNCKNPMLLLIIVLILPQICAGQELPKHVAGPESTTQINLNVVSNIFNEIDNLGAVLIRTMQSPTTSITKRSTSDYNAAVLLSSSTGGLTTMSPPLLTTLKYMDKLSHHPQPNLHHRNYELDLERDHALPTSAPNADILKSNSNPTYPNPNRHHIHERERQRHLLNSTPVLGNLPTLHKKNILSQQSNPEDMMPSYSPPARAFFTPPLPPEYQNPFADKPTLRGTNNEGGSGPPTNGGSSTYINRRPIPPPSLMPGHERIPLRPPEVINNTTLPNENYNLMERQKENPTKFKDSQTNNESKQDKVHDKNLNGTKALNTDTKQEILPSIRRILSGSNGNKGEIPEVLLKQVTISPSLRPAHHAPSSPVVLLDISLQYNQGFAESNNNNNNAIGSNINQQKTETSFDTRYSQSDSFEQQHQHDINENQFHENVAAAASAATATSSSTTVGIDHEVMTGTLPTNVSTTNIIGSNGGSGSSSSSSSTSTKTSSSSTVYPTWPIAWNIHVYLSVILFTILAVYSCYKLLTYSKLTHLFPQSYFLCIHLILITISSTRIFYLCYDAYNIHGSFNLFVSEILLNLPATLLTISFAVLILFLFRKSLNHKHNRYSALVRPLTVIVGCGVHVILCVTLHYVESYTLQNYYQQQQQLHLHQQQHQQHIYYQQLLQRQRQNQQQTQQAAPLMQNVNHDANYYHHMSASTHGAHPGTMPPPRVLSLICQIIYIFVCLSLGLLYLYLYRILKRILRSKSQNYIHGYQNLSYAIHITIATALLFVLLATLQIFGAIGISTKRSLFFSTQSTAVAVVAEIDWLQWGYQFSLRLIEIAIITLISWVAGLKTKTSGTASVIAGASSNMPLSNGVNSGQRDIVGGAASREKYGNLNHQQQQRSHAGFFLPCTSSSSQEQFETDYPAVCSANTNLHTYTMRTGKLIYDDSFALNSLGQPIVPSSAKEFQQSNFNYQRPYDTNSLRSVPNVKYQHQQQQKTQRFPHPQFQSHTHRHPLHHQYATTDYLTDATTDHYENPNFDIPVQNNSNLKFTKTTSSATSTTTAASSRSGGAVSSSAAGSGTSAATSSSQQQILLLQSESCYSEPNYGFSTFERPRFDGSGQTNPRIVAMSLLDPNEHLSSNSCASSGSTSSANFTNTYAERRCGRRYASYNSFERDNTSRHSKSATVRKSGTLNNIVSGNKYNGIAAKQYNAEGTCLPNEDGISDHTLRPDDVAYEHPVVMERSNSRTPLQMTQHHSDTEDRSEGVEDNPPVLRDNTMRIEAVPVKPMAI